MAFYIDYGMSPGMNNARDYALEIGALIEFREIGKNK